MSCDSLVNSDYETALVGDTDGAGYTKGKGGLHQDMEEGSPATALTQSLEPVLVEEPQSLLDHGTSSGHQGAQVSRAVGWPWGEGSPDGTETHLDPATMSANRSFPDQVSVRAPEPGPGIFEPLSH